MLPFHRFEPVRRRSELTPRESEVLKHVLAGKPNKLIAYTLGISQRTVEVHRSRIFQKMGVRNAIELVSAIYAGLQPMPSVVSETMPTYERDVAARESGRP